jgi:hypothetical protein
MRERLPKLNASFANKKKHPTMGEFGGARVDLDENRAEHAKNE